MFSLHLYLSWSTTGADRLRDKVGSHAYKKVLNTIDKVTHSAIIVIL